MRTIYFWIGCMLLLGSVKGQEEMTLQKAISIALENNFGIKAADKAILIAEKNNSWARAGKGLTIDLNGFFQNGLTNDANPAAFINGTYYTGSLGASLDAQLILYNGGRVALVKDQLNLGTFQQKLNKEVAYNELFRSVIQAYYNVVFQKERLSLQHDNLALSKGRLSYENTRKEFGASNSYNIIQFENAVITDSLNLTIQNNQFEIAKRNLNTVLNEETFAQYSFIESLSLEIEEIDEQKLSEVMFEDNYTLKSLAMVSELNELNTRLAKASRKPTISAAGSLGLSESAFKLFDDNPVTGDPFDLAWAQRLNLGLSANLNWNLYDGGVRKDDIQIAKLNEELAALDVLEAKAAISNQLTILVQNYNDQLAQLKLSDDQIQLANRNIEITEERFKNGQITSLDFRNVQNQLLVAQLSKLTSIYNLTITKSEIDYLVGKFENEGQ